MHCKLDMSIRLINKAKVIIEFQYQDDSFFRMEERDTPYSFTASNGFTISSDYTMDISPDGFEMMGLANESGCERDPIIEPILKHDFKDKDVRQEWLIRLQDALTEMNKEVFKSDIPVQVEFKNRTMYLRLLKEVRHG